MFLIRRAFITVLVIVALTGFFCSRCHAQAALLLEEPYGFFGTVIPTGHSAIYLGRICAETPVKLRRCRPGELGSVIARYQGIGSYDWVAMPLLPYLYSVKNASDVPANATRKQVKLMRDRYHEAHLQGLGDNVHAGNLVHGGWTELLGTAYERRIYAFLFETTSAQDDALIARMNASPNRSRFNFFYNNCSDFGREILNFYLPGTFGRRFFPDAGMTTPKQFANTLVRYAQLTVFEIPQLPGSRRLSRKSKGVAESLATTVYAVPMAMISPYLAGGLFVDYLVHRHARLIPRHPRVLGPDDLSALAAPVLAEVPASASERAPGAANPQSIQNPNPVPGEIDGATE